MKYYIKLSCGVEVERSGGKRRWLRGVADWSRTPDDDFRISLVLTDAGRCKAWSAEINQMKVEQMKQASGNERLEELLKRAFQSSTDDVTGAATNDVTSTAADSSFSFEIKDLKMKWKIVEEDIKLTLGIFDLTQMDFEEANNMVIDNSFREIAESRRQMSTLNDKNAKLQSYKSQLESTLEECVEEKNSLEDKMMQEFLLILNSKKKEIRRLTAIVENSGKSVLPDDDDEDEDGSDEDDGAGVRIADESGGATAAAAHEISDSGDDDTEEDDGGGGSESLIKEPGADAESSKKKERSKSIDSQNFLDLSSQEW